MLNANIQTEDIESILMLCDSFQIIALQVSINQEIINLNSVAEELFFRSRSQLLGKSFIDICRDFGFDSPVVDLTTRDHHDSVATANWVSDKHIIDVTWTLSQILHDEQCIAYLVTGKVMAKHVVGSPPFQLEAVMNSHFINLSSKDIDGNFVFINDHLARFSCINKRGFSGKNDYLMPWYKEADILRRGDNLAIEQDTTVVLEEHATVAEGKQHCFHVTKSPLKDAQGKLLGTVCTSILLHQPRQTLFVSQQDNETTFISLQQNVSQTYLTKKEITCVTWMIKGKSSTEIANILHVSPRTIETHINNIKTKLKCFKQFQLGYLFGKYGHLLI